MAAGRFHRKLHPFLRALLLLVLPPAEEPKEAARRKELFTRYRGAPHEASRPLDGFLKHYKILRKFGEGGMGIVLLARDIKLERLVVIKVLQDSGQATSRLLVETRATARCRHENIVVIHDVDETDGHPSTGGQSAGFRAGEARRWPVPE